MKIERKVEMNLPQLLEWAWDNPKSSRNKRFVSENKEFPYVNQYVIFNEVGYAEIENSYCYGRNDLFTVEVEETVTEDTELDLIERFIGGMGSVCYTSHTMSVKEYLKRSPRDCTTTHFYIENEDRELILIWRDGKLVN